MLILERSITQEHAEHIQRYVWRRLDAGRYRQVGKTSVYQLHGHENVTTYAYLANGEPIAWLKMQKRPGWIGYEVKHVWVQPQFRGKGLMETIYRAAINTDQQIVISGVTQTRWARALWARFVQKRMFRIWAQDLNNLSHRGQVFYDEEVGELYSLIPHLYTRDYDTHKKHDVRLVAIRN